MLAPFARRNTVRSKSAVRETINQMKPRHFVEARVGFEPTNGGFADLSLGPLGYRALTVVSISKPIDSVSDWRIMKFP
jgi:hypothetical protein